MKGRIFCLFSVCFLFAACEAMQDSAGRALNSAGTVVRHESKKIYIQEKPQQSSSSSVYYSDEYDEQICHKCTGK